MPEFPSLAHIAVTVTDLDRSTRGTPRCSALRRVLDEDEEGGAFHHTVYVLGGGQLFGLHTHPEGVGDQLRRALYRSRPRLFLVP